MARLERTEKGELEKYPQCIIRVMSLEKMLGSLCFCNLALFLLVTHSPFPILAADSYCRADFPSDFVFGAGSSSYQVPLFPYIYIYPPTFTVLLSSLYLSYVIYLFFPIFSTIARNLSLLFRTRLVECANLLSTGLRLALLLIISDVVLTKSG